MSPEVEYHSGSRAAGRCTCPVSRLTCSVPPVRVDFPPHASRRRTVALASAASLLALSVLVVLVVVVGTRRAGAGVGAPHDRRAARRRPARRSPIRGSARGRDAGHGARAGRWRRPWAWGWPCCCSWRCGSAPGPGATGCGRRSCSTLEERVQGRLYVGAISGGLLSGVTVDSIEMRGPDDSLFVARGRVHVDLRSARPDRPPRAAAPRRGRAPGGAPRAGRGRRLELPAHLPAGRPSTGAAQPGAASATTSCVDSRVGARTGAFELTMPWHPADSLRGARRDSAVTANAPARPDAEIRRRGRRNFTRTWRWTTATTGARLRAARRSRQPARRFVVARLDATRATRRSAVAQRARRRRAGSATRSGSTSPHFDLPGSTGTGARQGGVGERPAHALRRARRRRLGVAAPTWPGCTRRCRAPAAGG